MDQKSPLTPPVAPRRPHSVTTHGITIVDDYAWLKDENWQDVLRDPSILDAEIRRYLEAENAFTESLLGHTAALQKRLVKEMRGRIKEDDSSVPSPDGPYAYLQQVPRGRPASVIRTHARAMAARPRSFSMATSLPHTTNISSSAARGIRRIIGFRPGAPTPKVRNIFRSGFATGRPRRISTTSSRRPTAAWCGTATRPPSSM